MEQPPCILAICTQRCNGKGRLRQQDACRTSVKNPCRFSSVVGGASPITGPLGLAPLDAYSSCYKFPSAMLVSGSGSDAHHASVALTCNRWVLPGTSFAPKPRSITPVCGSSSNCLASLSSNRSRERIAMKPTSSAEGKSKRKSTFQCKVLPRRGNRFPFPKPHSANRRSIVSRIGCGRCSPLRVACRTSRRANVVAPFSASAEPT